jgi:hypothetical protein
VPDAPASGPSSSPSHPSGSYAAPLAKKRPPPPPGGMRPDSRPTDPDPEPELEPESAGASPGGPPAPPPARAAGGESELDEWKRVFEEYRKVREQCGESTSGLTFEKFQGTLQKNKSAILARHPADRVRFTVYVKDGKAALKASPVKSA